MSAGSSTTPGSPNDTDMGMLCGQRRIIIASNRGPVEFHREPTGRLGTRRGPGGVVTALAALAKDVPLTWVAATMSDTDREAFPTEETPARQVRLGREPLLVRYVPITPQMYAWHYDEVSNRMLWFLQHYLWDTANSPNFTEEDYRYWDEGYRPVNEAIARTVAAEATTNRGQGRGQGRGRGGASSSDGSDALVLLQDYHLYLTAALVRTRLPRAIVQQFIHIPWPAMRYWEFMPERFVREIFEGLAANDVLGFQTQSDVRNFLLCAREFLAGSRVDLDRETVYWRRHRLQARAYPIPIDAGEVRRELHSAAGRRGTLELGTLLDDEEQVLVRVDRLDPTKNIVRGFRAFQLLLRQHPELQGKLRFLAFLVPSRQTLQAYKRYDRDVRTIIRQINSEFGTPSWKPITAYFENNRPRALAAMRRYDVLLVNPIIDGMNLVVKEGPAINERDGVLILSRTAGAYTQLSEAALATTATDLAETAEQLYEALTMSERERHDRAELARQVVTAETPSQWVYAQVRDAVSTATPARETTRPHLSRAG